MLLGDPEPGDQPDPPSRASAPHIDKPLPPRPAKREAATVYVVGVLGAALAAAFVPMRSSWIPAALVVTWLAGSKITGVHLPPGQPASGCSTSICGSTLVLATRD